MDKKTWIIEAKVKIDEEFIDDVMCTALEGGICYWCDKVEIQKDGPITKYASEQISKDGLLFLHLAEGPIVEGESETVELNLSMFLKGVRLFWEWQTRMGVGFYTDPCDIDAEAADSIIQFALFDEIVFG